MHDNCQPFDHDKQSQRSPLLHHNLIKTEDRPAYAPNWSIKSQVETAHLFVSGLSFDWQVDLSDKQLLTREAARQLKIDARLIQQIQPTKISLDARKKPVLKAIVSFAIWLDGGVSRGESLLNHIPKSFHPSLTNTLRKSKEPSTPNHAHAINAQQPQGRPCVIGAGCAGLFAALTLAERGFNPILLERGAPVFERAQAIEAFFTNREFNPSANIQFGCGGAGTFSDGKLSTGTHSPSHRYILETFVRAGAHPDILIDAAPHIGSDVLVNVTQNIVERIKELGGTVRFYAQVTDIVRDPETGALRGLTINKTEHIETHLAILATGHSARDTYRTLQNQGVFLEQKPFAMGVRIEHNQRWINQSQYALHPDQPQAQIIRPAAYKLSCKTKASVNAFSFCMCPGGVVVAANSEPNQVVTNGMSDFLRNGSNANAGFLIGIGPELFASLLDEMRELGIDEHTIDSLIINHADDPLLGMYLQELLESQAFCVAGANYQAPAQLVGDFLADVTGASPRVSHATTSNTNSASIDPTYPLGVSWLSMTQVLPRTIRVGLADALGIMARKLKSFDHPHAILTGVETRSSAPVRIVRDRETLMSCNTAGLYPAGEGAGYAGGIMSAAADGIRVASELARQLNA